MATEDDYLPFAGSADGDGYHVVGVDLSSGPGYVAMADEHYHNLIFATRAEGAAAERARIRQLALDEAERHGNEGGGIQNKTLRDFAVLLEDR